MDAGSKRNQEAAAATPGSGGVVGLHMHLGIYRAMILPSKPGDRGFRMRVGEVI